MTLITAVDIHHAAARAALAVPGVAGLQPSLGHRLADAAVHAQQTVGIPATPPEAGIRAERTPEAPGWHVEVRCILHEERRVLDAAREVREQVRSAVTAHLDRHGTPEPVTILVTVTQTMSRTPQGS
ncbi:hypothetical protein ABZW18_15715 [Streptomyces sp. NPDC004647]|uniref:hypothetical protein n=1 Tax=Streptomyces sp. NPDC004647 TaxID=3154671 RepID=UPI0033A84C80